MATTEKKVDNLALWSRVEKTDPKYTKEVKFGRKFTSINAQYQVMAATKEFGSYGKGWGIKHIEYEFIDNLPSGQVMALAKAQFFFPDGEFPISSTIMISLWNKKEGELRVDDEWAKKIETDITTKALSKLGFSADVFLGRYDDNRYVNNIRAEFDKAEAASVPKKELTDSVYESMKDYIANGKYDLVEKSLSGYNVNKHTDALLLLIQKAKSNGGK